jgi:hypothetical protein
VTDAELIVASRHDPAAFRELYDRWPTSSSPGATGGCSTPRSPPTCWPRRSRWRSSAATVSGTLRRRVEATGRSVSFEIGQREPDGELMDAREQRYQAGCAIVVAVGPAGNAGPDVIARINHKG